MATGAVAMRAGRGIRRRAADRPAASGRRTVVVDDAWNARHRGEGALQRADRNFADLLQELRVTQTGVQILFAFLLGMCFTPRFDRVTEFQRDIYLVTLVCSALTAALLIAPVAAHRLQFQRGRKAELVRIVHRCVLAGLAALLVTVTGAILLVLDVVLGGRWAVVGASVVAGCFVALWLVLPSWPSLARTARRGGLRARRARLPRSGVAGPRSEHPGSGPGCAARAVETNVRTTRLSTPNRHRTSEY
ncbi:MAG: DUF6328 family protein [Pseudonocardia sp.]